MRSPGSTIKNWAAGQRNNLLGLCSDWSVKDHTAHITQNFSYLPYFPPGSRATFELHDLDKIISILYLSFFSYKMQAITIPPLNGGW